MERGQGSGPMARVRGIEIAESERRGVGKGGEGLCGPPAPAAALVVGRRRSRRHGLEDVRALGERARDRPVVGGDGGGDGRRG